MTKQEQFLFRAAVAVNWIAAGAIVAMMLLVSADVLLRLFRAPIPGAHDIVGFLAILAVSLSLSYTTVMKSHIAVDFIVEKLPWRVRNLIDSFNALAALAIFLLITWQSGRYGLSLKASGETAQTMNIPLYPFVFGISVGCGFLCIILAFQFFISLRKTVKP